MEQTEKKRKRPQDDAKRKRQKQVVFRLTESEHEEMKRRVDLSGKTQEEFLRNAIFNCEILNTEGARSLLPDLKRIGNNINQISQKLNSGGFIEPKDWQHVRKEFDEAWRLLRELAAARR